MCSVRVTFVLLITIFLVRGTVCKSIKKNQKDIINPITNDLSTDEPTQKPYKNRSKNSSPASPILAIEIVDSNENSTEKSKNRKRTAGSQLGYGYQPNNYFGVSSKPKLVYYKYSQDIPPYQGNNYYTNGRSQDVHVQKSVQYDLSKVTGHIPHSGQQQSVAQNYQPGTTLFTTFDQNGHINQLTSQIPQQSIGQNTPVVYLKIYSNQLSNGALYPNLPDSHPYSNINGVNLQSLLSNYLQNAYAVSGQQVYYSQPQYHQPYQTVDHNYQQDYYLTQPIIYHQNYQDQLNQNQYQQYEQPQQVGQTDAADDLPTHENYPDDAHTRVIFHSNNGGHFPEKPQALKSNAVPSISTYKAQTGHIPPAESYSSLEFKPSQPDYSANQQTQEEGKEGYYYHKPSASYDAQNTLQNYQSQYAVPTSQNIEIPYNYHAHPTTSKKRNARKPDDAVYEKNTSIKRED
ncbi:hypothetical protein Trydic_g7687 [Trypoxylus dichotomus]